MRRPQAPKQLAQFAPGGLDSSASALHLEIPLVPEPVLLRRCGGLSGAGNVLNVVSVDGYETAHALWPQRRDDARGAPAPVVAGEHGAIDGKCIHQFVQIVAERGLLTRARRRPVKKTRRTKTAQIRHDHAGAGGDERRENRIIAAGIVGPAMHQKDRRTVRRAALLVSDVKHRGSYPFGCRVQIRYSQLIVTYSL